MIQKDVNVKTDGTANDVIFRPPAVIPKKIHAAVLANAIKKKDACAQNGLRA